TGMFNLSEIDKDRAENSLDSISLSTGNDQSIFNWSSDTLPFNVLRSGIYDVHIHLERTTGNKDITITPVLYNISLDGTQRDILITFQTSTAITDTRREYDLKGTLPSELEIPDNRLLLEFQADVPSGGSNTVITIYMEGTTDSHLTVETSSQAFENTYLRLDGQNSPTKDIDWGGFDLLNPGNLYTKTQTNNHILNNATALNESRDIHISDNYYNKTESDISFNALPNLTRQDVNDSVGNWSLDRTDYQKEIGVDCDAGDFVKGVDDDGTLDCDTPASGGGAAGDKWLDDGAWISPNSSFAPWVNATLFTVNLQINISEGGIKSVAGTSINASEFYDDGVLLVDTDTTYTNASWDLSQIPNTGNVGIGDYNFSVNTSIFFVDSTNDRVGIGTDSPDSVFHIKADIPGTVGSHSAGQLIIQNPTDTVFSNVVITGYESDGDGNPDQQLWYLGSSSGSNSDITFLNRRNAKLTLGTNGTSRITILGNGDVGIGTATPSHKLEVAGSMNVSGDINASAFYDDGVLLITNAVSDLINYLTNAQIVLLDYRNSTQVNLSIKANNDTVNTKIDSLVLGNSSREMELGINKTGSFFDINCTSSSVSYDLEATDNPNINDKDITGVNCINFTNGAAICGS
ncbi:hypothetical protein LCGC14_0891700, partial [marine sediment metagenome]